MNQPEEQIDDIDTEQESPEIDDTQESLARQLVDILCEDSVPKAFGKKKVKGAGAGKKVATAPGSVKYGKK